MPLNIQIMYVVAGSNLFGQWFLKQVVLDNFTQVVNIDNNLDITKAKLIWAAWSYNIFKINNIYIIYGAWKGKENQSIVLPLPEDCTESSKLLITCNDYNIIIVDVDLETVWVFNLELDSHKKVSFNEVSSKTENKENFITKVTATNNTCTYLTIAGDIYIGLLPSYFETSHIGKVCDIQCGYEHYMILTDNGKVYTWGNGRRLQLGHGDVSNIEIPTEIEALSGIKIVKIRAGGWHSMALSEFGDLYIWGWNDTGQLGIKTTFKKIKDEQPPTDFGIPTLVNIFDEDENEVEVNIKDIACGTRHSVILLEDNSVWTSGNNKYGQLGFAVKEYSKFDYFQKAYRTTDNAVILCGPWCTIIECN